MPTIIDGTTGVDNIKTGSVEVQDISATGTPSNSTFLRGDGSWQSPAGGVTSLNGQTGAITDTNFDSIGSYALLWYAINLPGGQNGRGLYLATGTTIAGSSLRYSATTTTNVTNSTVARLSCAFARNNLPEENQVNGPTNNTFNTTGTAAVSGTWRLVGSNCYGALSGEGQGFWFPLLWVRIS